NGSGALDDTSTWDGSRWEIATRPSTGPSLARSHAVYDRERREVFVYGGIAGGQAALTFSAETWRLRHFGVACATSAECPSGSCVDGVCCRQSSCAACERCDDGQKLGLCT